MSFILLQKLFMIIICLITGFDTLERLLLAINKKVT